MLGGMHSTETAFLEAVKAGDLAQVTRHVDDEPSLLDARPAGAPSAALLAVYHGHPEVAEALVERGATVSVFLAAALGLSDVLSALLDEGPAAVDAVNEDGFQPLGLACFFARREAAELLLARGAAVNSASRNAADVMPLHSAVASRSVHLVRTLLEQGADANARQAGGFTPLHGAAQNGDASAVELLLAAGADARALDGSGRTALELTDDEGVRALLEAAAA